MIVSTSAGAAFSVGPILVDPPVLLAPMEDVSNLAFRVITKDIAGPGLMFTEFVSAMAIHHGAAKTFKKMRILDRERPLGIQIFGGDPDVMAETARLCEEMGADLVDINMGCWVPKVCRTGSGAALLKDPETAEKIVESVVHAVRVPVTVKVRAGWDWSLFAAPDLAKRFEGAGAKMLTLHARFAKQGFDGEANWKLISELREAVSIPLVGNGDVKTSDDALRMMRETGCNGVMVGRAAIANPWAMSRIVAGVRRISEPREPTLEERAKIALRHAKYMIAAECEAEDLDDFSVLDADSSNESRAIRALRGQLPLYLKGVPGAPQFRARLSTASTYAEVEGVFAAALEIARATNLH